MSAFEWVFHPAAVAIGVTFSMVGASVAIHQIYQHLSRWTHAHLQKYITRILLMVPIYAVSSSISLLAGDPWGAYLDVLRDGYEGYVLYQFMALLIGLCGGEQELNMILSTADRPRKKQPHSKVNRHFINMCRQRVLQYAFVKPILALSTVFFMAIDVYNENDYSPAGVYLYIILIYNLSLTISLYYLLLFGWELSEEFRYFSPTSKFLCIKSVIFFAFWQTLAISFMSKTGLLGEEDGDGHTADTTAKKLNNFLICCEMLGIAVLHHRAFSYKKMKQEVEDSPYFVYHAPKLPPDVAAEGRKRIVTHLKSVLNVSDIVQDSQLALKGTKGALLDHAAGEGEEEMGEHAHPALQPELVLRPMDDDYISDGLDMHEDDVQAHIPKMDGSTGVGVPHVMLAITDDSHPQSTDLTADALVAHGVSANDTQPTATDVLSDCSDELRHPKGKWKGSH